jgi:hypothetical protein
MSPQRRRKQSIDVPLHCPNRGCISTQAAVASVSTSTAILECLKCGFVWSIDVAALTDTVRRLVIAERQR